MLPHYIHRPWKYSWQYLTGLLALLHLLDVNRLARRGGVARVGEESYICRHGKRENALVGGEINNNKKKLAS